MLDARTMISMGLLDRCCTSVSGIGEGYITYLSVSSRVPTSKEKARLKRE